jgi:hypothetical protein
MLRSASKILNNFWKGKLLRLELGVVQVYAPRDEVVYVDPDASSPIVISGPEKRIAYG